MRGDSSPRSISLVPHKLTEWHTLEVNIIVQHSAAARRVQVSPIRPVGVTPPFAPRWSGTMRFIGLPGRRKSLPATEVDDDVYAAMHEIARERHVSVYDVCRAAYRYFVDAYRFDGGEDAVPQGR